MNCPKKEQLVKYHHGKVSFADYKKINEHLTTCDSCSVFLEEYVNGPNDRPTRFHPKFWKVVAIVVFLALCSSFFFFFYNEEQVGVDVVEVNNNNIELAVTQVVADDNETIVYVEIRDLENRENYFFDFYNFSIDKSLMGPFTKQNDIFIEKTESGVSRGVLHLLPLLTEEDVITIRIGQMFRLTREEIQPHSIEWYDNQNRLYIDGEWELQVPIKKDHEKIINLNENIDIQGTNVNFTKLVISPTKTALTFEYYRDNSNHHNHYILLSHLEVNGEAFPINYQRSVEENNKLIDTVFFNSIFYKDPSEITIHFDRKIQHIANQVKFDFDLHNGPFTFFYEGEEITVEDIAVGDPTIIRVKEQLHKNRTYQSLRLETRFFRFQEANRFEISTTTKGIWLDQEGTIVNDPLTYQDAVGYSYYTTDHLIEIFSTDGGDPFEPKFIYIEGYTNETNLYEKKTISIQ